jgi:hypothetical protein
VTKPNPYMPQKAPEARSAVIHIRPGTHDKLKMLSERHGMPMGAVVEELIMNELVRVKQADNPDRELNGRGMYR